MAYFLQKKSGDVYNGILVVNGKERMQLWLKLGDRGESRSGRACIEATIYTFSYANSEAAVRVPISRMSD